MRMGLLGVQELVFHGGDGACASSDVSPANNALGVLGCCLVERRRDRCPPVDKEGNRVFIKQRNTADIVPRLVTHVEAPKNQTFFDVIEACRQLCKVRGQGVALGPSLRISHTVIRIDFLALLAVLRSQFIKARISAINEALFFAQVICGAS